MCRNIKMLFNFDPPATEQEIKDASLQFVRKLSGINKPSKINEDTFNKAVEKVAADAKFLLSSLSTDAMPHDREVEVERTRLHSQKRFSRN